MIPTAEHNIPSPRLPNQNCSEKPASQDAGFSFDWSSMKAKSFVKTAGCRSSFTQVRSRLPDALLPISLYRLERTVKPFDEQSV